MRHISNLLAPKFLFLLALVYTLFITIGSLISTSSIPKLSVVISDKLIHTVGYFMMLLLWVLFVFFKSKSNNIKPILKITAGIVFAYGIIIEVLQGVLTETRTADMLDILANAVGIILAVLVVIVFQNNLIKLKSKN